MLIKPFSGIRLKYYFMCLLLWLLDFILPLMSVYVGKREKKKRKAKFAEKNVPVSFFEGINKL